MRLRDHRGPCRLRQPQGRLDLKRERALQESGLERLDALIADPTGVVDQHVDPAVRG